MAKHYNEPINEFHIPDGVATQSFPVLHSFGTGDPTCSNRCRSVSLTETFIHLIKYADVINGQFKWCFVTDPRFPYWALSMKQHHQLLLQNNNI